MREPMASPSLPAVDPLRLDLLDRHPRVLPLVIYIAFAALVYLLHGAEPSLSIDHISYFKLADEIRASNPDGVYYRNINSVRSYGVILAYLYDYTGSHVISLKLLLAVMTVAYLAAFQLFMGLLTPVCYRAVLFSLMSSLFVSFGASIWGMTDFAASLNRTIIIPFVVVLVWGFFRWFDSPWRYAVYPALVLLSLLHLSALHVALVFAAFEALDFVFRRRFRITWDVAWLLVALAASAGLQFSIERLGAGTTGFVRYTLHTAVPATPQRELGGEAGMPGERETAGKARKGVKPGTPGAESAKVPSARETPSAPDKLSVQQAWEIELFAFPWRNMPPRLPTLAAIAMSYGMILALAILGAVRAFRSGATALDRLMVTFAGGVLLAAYGLQTTLWVLRNVMPIFPVNFEEIRAVNMLMFPSVYFVYRLYEQAQGIGRISAQAARAAIVLAFVLQPIVLVRAAPTSLREGILDAAVDSGLIKRADSLRVMYARHFLGLSNEGRRFYYSARDAIDWLDRNAGPKDLVLTNVDDFIILRARTVGTFLSVMSIDVWDHRRGTWLSSLDEVDRTMAVADTAGVERLARQLGATFAVVPWPVEDAVYRDPHFSILRLQ